MSESIALDNICKLLTEKYGERGRVAAAHLQRWLSGAMPFAYPEIIAQLLDPQHLSLLFDSFWQVLPFGTGGRRGRVGYGPNRLNPTTLAMTIQGHCIYLRRVFKSKPNLSVVVANDVRVFKDIAGTYKFLKADHPLLGVSSRSLAKLACEIYASNGLTAFLANPGADDAVLSTPELSFVIGELKSVGGVNLSASHNPPDDNGVKVYDEFGSQPIAPNDEVLVNAMAEVTGVRPMPFAQALAQGLIREVPQQLHAAYIATYEKVYDNIHVPQADLPIVYTPLCGCGLTTVGDVLQRLKFPVLTPPDEGPDGTFAVIPFKAPNPEVPQATEPAKTFADAHGSGIVLSSDPDADRVGLEAKLADGTWYHFDGNQIAAILCYYLMLDPEGPRRKGLVIETLVTTKILRDIVNQAGGSFLIDDLLVGFKYIAHVLKSLQREGRYREITCSPEQLVLAAEESHGVIVVPTIRDKDATPACMYLAALYQILRRRKMTLLDYYISILEQFGAYDTVNRSITMTGAEGIIRKDRIMETLRQNPPKVSGGQEVRKALDFWDQQAYGPFVSETDRLPRNVLQLFTDRSIITIRPSGTEPKLKFYCQLLPDEKPSPLSPSDRERLGVRDSSLSPSDGERGGVRGATRTRGTTLLQEARAKADAISRRIYNELLAIIGVTLSEAALWLPDIVDLDCKQHFDRQNVPQLHEALKNGKFANLNELLAWLRKETAAMTPGANPLPALKAPVGFLCQQWSRELAHSPLFNVLAEWTTK